MTDTRHIYALDGLRGLSAYYVFITHFSGVTKSLGGPATFGGGVLGLMLFFSLSGFLMAHLYFGQKLTLGSGAVYFQRRMARIAPLYLFIVLTSFALTLTVSEPFWAFKVTTANIIDHLLFQRAAHVMWTIPVEVAWYCLFPIVWLVRDRLGMAATVAVLCALIAAGFYIHTFDTPQTSGQQLKQVGHYFALGALVACLPRSPSNRWWDIAFIIGLALLPILSPRISGLAPIPAPGETWRAMGQAIWSSPVYMAAVALILASAVRSNLAERILGSGPLRWLGSISYSLYLLHMPVFWYLQRFASLAETPLLFLLVAHAIVIPLSVASYWLLERPARRMLNGLAIPVPVSRPGLPLSRSGERASQHHRRQLGSQR